MLTAVLKTKDLEIVQECEIPLEHFPDMIELAGVKLMADGNHQDGTRQFFKTGITDRRGFYREGSSYRITS